MCVYMNRLGVTTLALPREKKISWGEAVFCLGTFCFPPGASSGHFFLLSSWAKRTPWQHLEENRYYLNTGNHTMLLRRRLVSQPQKQTAQLTLSWPGAGIMEADYRQVTTVFTDQPSFHHRHSTKRVPWSVTVVGERAVTLHLVVCRGR